MQTPYRDYVNYIHLHPKLSLYPGGTAWWSMSEGRPATTEAVGRVRSVAHGNAGGAAVGEANVVRALADIGLAEAAAAIAVGSAQFAHAQSSYAVAARPCLESLRSAGGY